MPTSRKTTNAAMAAVAAMPSIPEELIDQFVTGPMSAQAVNAATMAFKKALIERALGAELSHHLGYRLGATKPEDTVNHRNGAGQQNHVAEVPRQQLRRCRPHQHRAPVVVDQPGHQRASVALDALHTRARRVGDRRARDRLDQVADHEHVRRTARVSGHAIEDPHVLEDDTGSRRALRRRGRRQWGGAADMAAIRMGRTARIGFLGRWWGAIGRSRLLHRRRAGSRLVAPYTPLHAQSMRRASHGTRRVAIAVKWATGCNGGNIATGPTEGMNAIPFLSNRRRARRLDAGGLPSSDAKSVDRCGQSLSRQQLRLQRDTLGGALDGRPRLGRR